MSYLRAWWLGMATLGGSSLPDMTGTLARWSVTDTVPDLTSGQWLSSSGSRMLEPVAGGFSYARTTLASGKPAIQFTGGPRLRLRGGLDLSASTSMAYIAVFESNTGGTQVLLEQSANYDAVPGRFICFIEGSIHPNFHRADGPYYTPQLPFAANTSYVLGSRVNPARTDRQARAQTQFDSDLIEDAAIDPHQFGADDFFVGGRGGSELPFVGKLSALHLFSEEPTSALFNQWLAYYAALYA